jgi:hypothetical protein
MNQTRLLFCLIVLGLSSGCRVLEPREVVRRQNNLTPHLIAEHEPQMERGEPRPIIDAFGWVWGIPSKILLWDRRVESHRISPQTEYGLQEYLAENDLHGVKVRLNQYHPMDDWRRLVRNKSVAWPWKYTFGAVSTLSETIFPGRLFGGDHYNPYTATIHLYSDVPAIAMHEGGHAKDFSNRDYPGTYAAIYALPIVPLYHERIASNDVLGYLNRRGDRNGEKAAYRILYPAYGTYVGGAAGTIFPTASTPVYAAGVLSGHAAGIYESKSIR